jgi:hypothetical protein
MPMAVTTEWQLQRNFVPAIGVGVVTIDPHQANPLKVLNQAEHIALLSARQQAGTHPSDANTTPAALC